jgi:hypothetical protein
MTYTPERERRKHSSLQSLHGPPFLSLVHVADKLLSAIAPAAVVPQAVKARVNEEIHEA